jgi:hypothetical protein
LRGPSVEVYGIATFVYDADGILCFSTKEGRAAFRPR